MSRYRQSMREALEQVAQVEIFDEAVKWEVKISGLPVFYVDGKSRGEVKQSLRRMLKKPDDIESIERTTPAALKKIRRGQAQGDEPGETNEEVEDAYDYKAKKGAIAAPGSGSIAKAKKAKAGDVNKSIEQQMKDALKEKMSVDDVINMIQFGKPFKVVDEDIPADLPPGDPNFPKYKDISNAEVDKEDKKANKVKDKAEKDTLVPTQTKEEVVTEQEGGVTDDSGYTRYPSSGNWAGIRGKTYKKNLEIAKTKQTAQDKERDALIKAVAKSPKQQALAKKQSEEIEIDEQLPVGHRSPSPGADSTDSYYKLQRAKERAKKAGVNYDRLSYGDQQKYDKEEYEIDEKAGRAAAERSTRREKEKKEVASKMGKIRWRQNKGAVMPEQISIEDTVAKVIGLKMDEFVVANRGSAKRSGIRIPGVSDPSPERPEKRAERLNKQKARARKKYIEAEPKEEVSITQKGLDALRKDRDRRAKEPKLSITPAGLAALEKDKKNQNKDPVGKQHEVAPPGFGHTKAEYEKTKPNKPKSKIGGTAHEFDKDLKSGKFKGLPGDKTMKDKKASMFKIMWSQHNKGDKPHYKPGVKDKLKSQYKEENLLDSAKRYLVQEKADWNTAFKSAAQSRPAMKYKDAVGFIDTAGLNSMEKRSALKAAKKWLR